MEAFKRFDNQLYCEKVSLEKLADKFGTPLYVYSQNAVKNKYKEFKDAFDFCKTEICFAAKANSNFAILKMLAQLGSGADIVSGGELHLALAAGINPAKIVYSGVGKTTVDMKSALNADILMFNIESFTELATLNNVAKQMNKKARISLRVNPNVDPKTHPYVSTGLKNSKFGIKFESVLEGYNRAKDLKNIEVVGVDCHIGSQLLSIEPFIEVAEKLKQLVSQLRSKGFDIKYLDLGGGLGITYDSEKPPSVFQYGNALKKVMKDLNVTLILEPGRNLIGNAGVLVSRVLYTKKADDKRFVIVDAGMNDLLRPSLYGSFHKVVPVKDLKKQEELVDIVGPICESGDFIAKKRMMPCLLSGDLVSIMSVGAYGFSMASTYNSRPLCAEMLVKEDDYSVIRNRDNYNDLMRNQQLAKWQI